MTSTHIIRRQVLDVIVAGTESDGLVLQKRLPDLCRDWLNPALEEVLERLTPTEEHWTIDRLDIDAGSFPPEKLERGLVEAVTEAIGRLLRERAPRGGATGASGRAERRRATGAIQPGAIGRRTRAQSLQEALLHFLETGVLPWWFHLPQGRTLEDVIRECWQSPEHPDGRPEHFARGLADAIGPAAVRKRLVRQFSPAFLETLLTAVSPDGASAVRQILAAPAERDFAKPALDVFFEEMWEAAFAMAAAGERPSAAALLAASLAATPSDADLRQALPLPGIAGPSPGAKGRDGGPEEKALPDGDARERPRKAAAKAAAHRPEPGEPASGIDLEEGVYVGCAGVVLLHPFLPRLFEALGIAKDDKLLQPERALCLLHFLATGQRFAPEYELLLPKLLCNVPFYAPARSRIELTAAEEDEAAALLAAVIRHWDALGDTSVDGLRGSFLVRPGKLSQRGGDHVLQVEARSFDILLDRLPWGIGLIQLPWMDRILWVEWRF